VSHRVGRRASFHRDRTWRGETVSRSQCGCKSALTNLVFVKIDPLLLEYWTSCLSLSVTSAKCSVQCFSRISKGNLHFWYTLVLKYVAVNEKERLASLACTAHDPFDLWPFGHYMTPIEPNVVNFFDERRISSTRSWVWAMNLQLWGFRSRNCIIWILFYPQWL